MSVSPPKSPTADDIVDIVRNPHCSRAEAVKAVEDYAGIVAAKRVLKVADDLGLLVRGAA